MGITMGIIPTTAPIPQVGINPTIISTEATHLVIDLNLLEGIPMEIGIGLLLLFLGIILILMMVVIITRITKITNISNVILVMIITIMTQRRASHAHWQIKVLTTSGKGFHPKLLFQNLVSNREISEAAVQIFGQGMKIKGINSPHSPSKILEGLLHQIFGIMAKGLKANHQQERILLLAENATEVDIRKATVPKGLITMILPKNS